MAQSNSDWSEIEDEDDNMLVRLSDSALQLAFLDELQRSTAQIKEVVLHHLGQECEVADVEYWLSGSFNVCIPVSIPNTRQRLILRCPFPFMLEPPDDTFVTSEKLRCEAATYAWISSNCQSVPIPHLWGFGLPNGLRFTPVAHTSWLTRLIESCKDLWARLRHLHRCAPFVARMVTPSLRSGYLLIDFVQHGTILSESWPPPSSQLRQNLYTSLARIMLSMSRVPLQAIGSFTIDNNGEMHLTNRPLTKHLPLYHREGVPSAIRRRDIYHRSDVYFTDLLSCLDFKLEHQPNAVRDAYDAEYQLGVHTALRAVQKHFILPEFRDGPFFMRFTDLHMGNIFVNDEYSITSIVDLEWCCSLPCETQSPPVWLTGRHVDEFDNEKERRALYVEWKNFIAILKQEEDCEDASTQHSLSDVMHQCLTKNINWYTSCLVTPRATYNLFIDHIQPVFAPDHANDANLSDSFQQIIARYWTPRSQDFIEKKLQDRQQYIRELRLKYRPHTEAE